MAGKRMRCTLRSLCLTTGTSSCTPAAASCWLTRRSARFVRARRRASFRPQRGSSRHRPASASSPQAKRSWPRRRSYRRVRGSRTLVPKLKPHLTVTRQAVGWFRPARPQTVRYGACPIFIIEGARGIVYGFPDFEGRGVKAAQHDHGPIVGADAGIPRPPMPSWTPSLPHSPNSFPAPPVR